MVVRIGIFAMLPLALAAQGRWDRGSETTRRADIRGGGGNSGKCTIEVEVDGVAEIEIRGDMGRMRTLSGRPASWRRFECNTRMPDNPGDFRFRGIDGRGRQELVNDPGGRGAAVIRIEDPKGGSEGYTFDIEWRGGGGRGDNLGWNDEVSFRGRGDGLYRNSSGMEDRLGNCRVNISRAGEVEVSFDTDKNSRLSLRGRITRVERDRLYADMSGNGIAGAMVIAMEGRTRVRDISMSGSGRMRYDLRWSN